MSQYQVSAAGRSHIQSFESCARRMPDGRYHAYPDPATGGAPWTIGWGSTGPDVLPDTIWTKAQCDARFERDVQAFGTAVAAAIGAAPTTQGQFDALVGFAYNAKGWRGSTLLKLHLAGRYELAAAEFGKWIYANHLPMNGLRRRRAAEAQLYRS